MLALIVQDGISSYPARGAKLNPDIKSRFLKASSPRISPSQGVESAFFGPL